MNDRYQEWYDAQVLKGRDMSAALSPYGGGRARHNRMADRHNPGADVDTGAEEDTMSGSGYPFGDEKCLCIRHFGDVGGCPVHPSIQFPPQSQEDT